MSVSARSASCLAHFPVLLWLSHDMLPRNKGYIRLNATRYHDWKVLAYANNMVGLFFTKLRQQFAEWLSQQPPAVARRDYTRHTGIVRRGDQVCNAKINASDEGVDIPKEYNEGESIHTEVGSAHDTKNDTLMEDAKETRRNPVNITSVGKLLSATCTGGDSDSIDSCYSYPVDESCAEDDQVNF